MKQDVLTVQRLVDRAMNTPKYSYPMLHNAPRPPEPFAGVRFVEENSPGFDKQEVFENANGTTTIRTTGSRILVFEILFTEGEGAASQFISSFYRQELLDIMKEGDLSILRHKNVQNETLTLETNWEIRHGVYLECLVRRVYEHTTELITAVSIDGDVWEGNDVYHVSVDI